MAEFRITAKQRKEKSPHSYFAVKSRNALYYQMASIFKYAATDRPHLADTILTRRMQAQQPNIFLEN